MYKSDSEIQQQVLLELKWDTRVDETEVGVQVSDGVVTLSGHVDSWAKRIAAQEAAHRVRGVLDVANELLVRRGGAGRTDSEIATAIRLALEWDALVPDERIRSSVSNGWVILEGCVDYYTEREDAERAVRNLSGVQGITNKIEVQLPHPDPDDLRSAIEGALERRAEREARGISLEVTEGRVAVSGTVRSWPEREAVLGAVRGTRGVRRIEDRLKVQPGTL